MVRSLLAWTVLVVVALAGGTAEARRLVCEREPDVSLLDTARVDDDSAPRLPIEHSVCVAGISGDPSCWDHEALPQPGRGLLLSFSDVYVKGSRSPLLAPPSPKLLRDEEAARPLAEGHARRLERPPRATAS
jgi:hypothetical protein